MRALFFATAISVVLATVMFLGGDPPSARGFYYVAWLSFVWLVWRCRIQISTFVKQSPFGEFPTYFALVIAAILLEETLAGIAVNILQVSSLQELAGYIFQFYANNLFLLPGFTLAWFFLLKRYKYATAETFTLVGLFGIFAEKVYIHIFTIPILGIPMILPTMFTYIGIILPAYLSIKTFGTRETPLIFRYALGCLLPIVCSVPFLFIYFVLAEQGIIDSTVLTR